MVEAKAQKSACNENCSEDPKVDLENASNSSEDADNSAGDQQESEENSEKSSDNTELALRKKIKELEGQILVLKEAVIRNLAETDNLRKRLEKEKSEAMKYANGKFAKDLLAVADNFDRVTQHIKNLGDKVEVDGVLKPIIEGVELCGRELLSVFRKHGIDQVDVSEGTHFDPNYHQAMCEIESDKHEPGTVINVMQSGYVYNDRLLRPAMVSVAKKS